VPDASRLHNVPDTRRLARRVLPRPLFDYIDGGAEGEVTMEENERAFREIAFRPRMGMKVDGPRLDTTVLGTPGGHRAVNGQRCHQPPIGQYLEYGSVGVLATGSGRNRLSTGGFVDWRPAPDERVVAAHDYRLPGPPAGP
jgi:hypothetical protein